MSVCILLTIICRFLFVVCRRSVGSGCRILAFRVVVFVVMSLLVSYGCRVGGLMEGIVGLAGLSMPV